MNGRSGSSSAAAGPSSPQRGAGAGLRSDLDLAHDMASSSPASAHPLSLTRSALEIPLDELAGPSTRPALERRTTATETAASSGDPPHAAAQDAGRQMPATEGLRRRSLADGSSGSRKGKERELVSATGDTENAVEVLVHQLLSTDSLPRIALQYGIDLAVLRKTNKLWTSDSLHVRRTLYIPLSACHLREELVRGPADDEVTLLQPEAGPRPDPVRDALDGAQCTPPRSSHSRATTTPNLALEGASPEDFDGQDNPWLLDGTNVSYAADHFADSLASLMPGLPSSAVSSSSPSPAPPSPPPRTSRTLKVALIDRKDLSFFPRSAPSSGRASLDSSLMHLKRSTPATPAIVGRRRPSSTTTHSPSLSRKISNLFLDVPATLGLPGPASPTSPVLPAGGAFFANGRPSLNGRQRSASDYGRGTSTSSRTSFDLGSSPPSAEHVELSAFAPPPLPPGRKTDWLSTAGGAALSDGIIRQQLAHKQPMMGVRDSRQNMAGRVVGDGLGNGRIKDVWIG